MLQVHARLKELIASEPGVQSADLSRMLEHTPDYVERFLRYRDPGHLEPDDRRRLARFFDVEEGALGGPGERPRL